MDAPRIPILNLYYLLCYSWDQLKQAELVDVSKLPTTELVDLLTLVLCEGIQHLARRGLEQGYQSQEEELAGIRGRINILGSARRFLPMHGRALCSVDDLTTNTLPNQILKGTLHKLGYAERLDSGLRKRVHVLHRDLRGIDQISLTSQTFRRVQLHANNRFYRFLLNVCELIHGSWLPDQRAGTFRFRDFLRDDRAMATVFQNFLLKFIKIELPEWNARRERIAWIAEGSASSGLSLLPKMETDISMRRGTENVIVEVKYYQDTLARRYDAEKIHSENLYQLMSYLSNAKRPIGESLRGMLIYPRVNRTLRERYIIQGFGVTVATVDLNAEWRSVKAEIVDLIC